MTEEVTNSLPEPEIMALATPYKGIVAHDYKHLREVLNSYWRANEDRLVNDLKIKTPKINGRYKNAQKIAENNFGIRKIYYEILWDETKKKLKNEHILYFEALDIVDFEEGKTPRTVIKFYKEPKLKLKEDLDFNVVRMSKWDKEELKESRLKSLQREHRIIEESSDGSIGEDSKVLLDLAYKDPDKVDVKNKWYEIANLSDPLKGSLLKSSKGESFELELEEEGKTIEVIVQVHEVHKIITPTIEEALVKAGFEDLEAFDKAFEESFEKDLRRSDGALAVDHIITQIVTKAELPPVPDGYVTMNVSNHIDDFFAKYDSKEAAMKSIGAVSDEQVWNKFNGFVMRNLLQDLAIKTFADLYDLDRDNYELIENEMYTACNFIDPE